MSIWSTKDGRVVWQNQPGGDYVVIDAIRTQIAMVYSAGEVSDEDDLHTWTFTVEGDELRKRFVTTCDGKSKVKTSTVIAGLEPLRGPVADRWETVASDLQSNRSIEASRDEHEAKRQASARISRLLLGVPQDCQTLVFVAVEGGWGVALPGVEPFWVERDYRWRGKDLHYELQLALKLADSGVTSFTADLKGHADMMAYYRE